MIRSMGTAFLGVSLAAAIGVGAVLGALFAHHTPPVTGPSYSSPPEAEVQSPDENPPEVVDESRLVDVIHPRLDPSFVISVSELADVKPYYRAELCAQVAGVIKYLQKNRGDRVVKGEPLIVIDVPDLVFAEKEKEAMVVKS